MKWKIILLFGIIVLFLAGLVFRFQVYQTAPPIEPVKTATLTNKPNAPRIPKFVAGIPDFLNTRTVAVTSAVKPTVNVSTNWPDDPRPEVQELYKFAKVAKLYNFDPSIAYLGKDQQMRNATIVDTTSDFAELDTRRNRIMDVFSYRDDSHAPLRDFDLDPAELRQSWIDCVGTWNQQQMIDETIRILRDMGYSEFLTIAQNGKFEFRPYKYQATDANGQPIVTFPFATVTLIGPDGTTRVTAEYRMGTDGQPAGLVSWTAR